MYKILKHYLEITGLPCMINTSFNMHEEPIVCSPHDAIQAFKLGHLDYLAIGNWLVKNPHPAERQIDRATYDAKLNATGARWG